MANELRYDGKVAIITGAGNGLGRSHALLLASRGAKVVVNDLGGTHTGGGRSSAAADKVVEEIKAAGGEAVANYDSVEDGVKIVQTALDSFGRVDIVVNNAGILRDVSYAKMSPDDWDLIYRVHVLGAHRVTAAAWPHLREQKYGRVIFTASAAGIYGNFGQANYAMAKLGLVGFASTLALEGKKAGVHVNTIAPIAGSRMTETVLPKELIDALRPEYVSPLVAWLAHESCDATGGLYEVGGGFMAKLRWERTQGRTWRLGRAITPEGVRDSWGEITDFGKATHPASVAESMAPIMTNVEAGQSKGGNDLIDVDLALGFESPEMKSEYTERDVSLYALGVGAARNPLDAKDLALVYEMNNDGFFALPTMTAAMSVQQVMKMAMEGKQAPGLKYGLDRVLHGEQYTEVTRPLPAKQKLTSRAKVKAIHDKGKGAVVVMEFKTFDEDGDLLAVNEISTFVRGAGGWGGDRGPAGEANTPPERAPDAVVEEKTADDQALLYRLSGDINPLHADPGFASMFGFDKPILHGLCTYGFAARHVIKALAQGDPRYFKSIRVRFAEPVFPGETLVTEMWREGDTKVVFRTKVKERDKVVLTNAAVELYKEIPQKRAKAANANVTQNPVPVSEDIFAGIRAFLKKNAELATKIGKVYQFRLTGPDSVWTIDLKTNAVAKGETAKSECTLEISDADFMAMATGKANPMKLFSSGKLKISGDLMASQKLDFLQKVDPNDVIAAMHGRLGSSGGGAAPAATPAPAKEPEPTSSDVFSAIGVYLEKNPDLAAKVAKVYQFRLTGPDSVWTLDLKANKVASGETAKPECTLELSDADFMAMVAGKANPMKLFSSGKLKISGDLMASQKLDFLQKLDRNAVAAAAASKPAASAAPAAQTPAAPAKETRAPAIFKALGERLAQNPALARELAARVQFNLRGSDQSWVVDATTSPATVSQGRTQNADAWITLGDDELAAIAADSAQARNLFQRGLLRVDGDVRVAHRLGIFHKLV
jgi:3-hydroxyacyl-CoA dehydrogenase/3a,7a,12a-trihydroxy-5b-cholest-24-enoyl-CoA hydratase